MKLTPSFYSWLKGGRRKMKLKCSFEIVDMGDELIAVPVGAEAANMRGVLKVNKEGAEILQLLESEQDESKIVVKLAEKYDNDHVALSNHVKNFLGTLIKEGFLSENA